MGLRPGQDDLTDVFAELYVERPSQKAIVTALVARASAVGPAPASNRALSAPALTWTWHVKIARRQRDPKQLRRLASTTSFPAATASTWATEICVSRCGRPQTS